MNVRFSFINKIFIIVVLFFLTVITIGARLSSQKGINMTSEANRQADTIQDMLVRISEIEVFSEYLREYLSFALTVGEISVREEPGVIAIFPMIQQRDSCQIRILEIYANREAYKHHIGTEHFRTYKQGTLHMVKSLDLVDMTPMNPLAMSEVFRKIPLRKNE